MAQGPNNPIHHNILGNMRTPESNSLLSTEITEKNNACLHIIQSSVTMDR
jgi:hypothetical protein